MNNKMLREAFKQLKLINVLIAVLMTLELIVVGISYNNMYGPFLHVQQPKEVFDIISLQPMLPVVCLCFFPIMIAQLFSWITSRRDSDFYHSIPIKRSTLFAIYSIASLTCAVVMYWVYAVGSYLILSFLLKGKIIIEFAGAVGWFVKTMIAGIMISGGLLIGFSLSNNGFNVTLTTMIVTMAPRGFLLMAKMIINDCLPRVVLKGSWLWDFRYNILFAWTEGYADIGTETCIYSLFLGLVYWAVGYYLFVNRKSENAEKTTINKHVQAVLRSIPSLMISMVGAEILVTTFSNDHGTGNLSEAAIAYIMAIAVYLIYELVTTKKISAMIRALPGLVYLMILNIIIVALLCGYVYYQKHIVINSDNIEAVVLHDDRRNYNELPPGERDYDMVLNALLDKEIHNRELIDYFVEIVNGSDVYMVSNDYVVEFRTKSGSVLRHVYFQWPEICRYLKNDDIKNVISQDDLLPPEELAMENPEYETFYKEAHEMTREEFATKYLNAYGSDPSETYFEIVEFRGSYHSMYISKDFPKTRACYERNHSAGGYWDY